MRKNLVFIAGLTFMGCMSSEPGPGAGFDDPLSTPEGFCSLWAEAACNEEVALRCGGTEETEDCVESQARFCEAELEPDNYMMDNAQECIDAVMAAYADARLDSDELFTVRRFGEPCDRLWRGSADEGDECDKNADCNTLEGYSCVEKGDAATCQVPNMVGGGRSCDDAAAVCEVEFYCDGSHCVERLGEGDSCRDDAECAAEFRCDSSESLCIPRLGVGETCSTDADCASNLCTIAFGDRTGICVNLVALSAAEPVCKDLR